MKLMTETLEKPLDSNYFEELVDKMVLDGIPGITQEFIDKINDLPKSQKRMAILSILDKDLNLFRRIKALTDQSINKMEHIKDIILMLRKYVHVGKVEKKKFGEVMTPIELVKEMIDKLPEEIWSNPNIKICDPANGSGVFPMVVIYKLMIGLKDWEPDEEKRYKHIVENMIYVCEIQPKNMFLYLCAIDPFDKYNVNIYTGSFLEDGFDNHMKKVWGIHKFDLILGNPPYQDFSDKKRGTTGKKNLYQKFIIKSLNVFLSFGGILLFVTPPSIFKTTSFNQATDIFLLLRSKNLEFVDYTDINSKYFRVGTPICFYLVKNNNDYKYTEFKTEKGTIEININNYNFIPRILSSDILSIIEKTTKIGVNFNFKRECKIEQESFITMKRLNHINKNGLLNVQVGTTDIKFDLTMECENPLKMVKLMNHKIFRFLNYVTRHDGVIYHYFLNGFKYPENLENIEDTDFLWNYYDISDQERDLIENFISD